MAQIVTWVPTSTTRPVGNLKIVGGVVRRPAQRDEQVILPLRHPGLRGRLQRAPRDKERRRHDIELPAELARDHQRLGHVRRFHETETQPDGRKFVADGFHPNPVGRVDARRLRGFNRQDHIVLVKHLVVLEIMQQRRRHEIRIAGEKNRGALDDVRRTLFEALDQILQRHLDAPGLHDENRRPPAPGPDHDRHDKPEQQRHPRAFKQFQEIGTEESHVDDDERNDHRSRSGRAPIPQLPDHDETHDAVGDHGGGDGDAVGGGQSA